MMVCVVLVVLSLCTPGCSYPPQPDTDSKDASFVFGCTLDSILQLSIPTDLVKMYFFIGKTYKVIVAYLLVKHGIRIRYKIDSYFVQANIATAKIYYYLYVACHG